MATIALAIGVLSHCASCVPKLVAIATVIVASVPISKNRTMLTFWRKDWCDMSNLPIIMGLRGQSSGEPRVQLAIYVADTRKDGQPLLRDEFETWVGLIGRALCEMAGGCTRYAAQGLYVRQSDGQLMRETTAVLKASAERRKVIEGLARLRSVLVQYGRECEQECVGFEVDGEFYTLDPSRAY